MKKFYLFIFLSFGLFFFSPKAYSAEKINYDSIYNNLPVLDIYYDHNEDPDENLDYESRVESPYPLIRISLKLACRDIKLLPGYYLMSPRNRSSYDFMMFKQNGKIVALIPIYEKQRIIPELTYPMPEKPKTVFKKTTAMIKSSIARPFKSYRKPPQSSRFIITSSVVDGGNYFEIWLYQEEYLYKMLFKINKT